MKTNQAILPSSEIEEAAFQDALRLADGLFAHQVEGIAFLLGRRRAILADDMGLGKTRQSIVALRHAEPVGPYLVVCPASVKHNWRKEILMVDSTAGCLIIESGAGGAIPGGFDGWIIVNYDILGRRMDELGAIQWKGLIFDEAHYLKNHTSQRYRHALKLAAQENAVVYALTGTPLTNRPRDLFPLLQMVRHAMARSFLSFAKRYCAATHNGHGWVTDGASNLEELTSQLHGIMLRRRKDDVLDLPPKIRSWVPVTITDGIAASEVRDVIDTLLAAKSGVSPRAARTRLLAKITKAREKIAIAKVAETIDLLEGIVDQEEKVIVFSCFDKPLQQIAKTFGDACLLLTGATAAGKRQGLVDRFQADDKVRVFVANIQAGGVGINLTAARHVVFNDLDWVPANHWQAEDRAYRIGQTGSVNVHYLVAHGTIDEFVQSVLQTKAALVEAVVDGAALSPEATRDILSELEAIVSRISANLVDPDIPLTDDEWVEALLKEVEHDRIITEHSGGSKKPVLSREALLTLARMLTRPASKIYRSVSKSDPTKSYILTFDSGEVTCTCPGFEFRGMCSHSKTLKSALDKGSPLPAGFEPASA
jgi:SWI/SNF-related matrix-associated actin-dependent regulator 1 of chromatin subfamily A